MGRVQDMAQAAQAAQAATEADTTASTDANIDFASGTIRRGGSPPLFLYSNYPCRNFHMQNPILLRRKISFWRNHRIHEKSRLFSCTLFRIILNKLP
jgi:hypothetical protein